MLMEQFQACNVSIRTRHRCRVMLPYDVYWPRSDKFQSAPGIAAG